MNEPVIKINNLVKEYRLGQRGTSYKTLGESLTKWTKKKEVVPQEDNILRAVDGISFEVKQGEVVGIIGRNGAGKSTLLKMLSRITEPSEGRIEMHGRVGSLLEVGTGFHPELTGRENIFLNGAILGMSKVEIRDKFDDIVEFAELSKFMDTPVKHYSSGMYVRLAFAVAAYLDPEIMIIDEVLAVGDAHFQKKCLGKMEDVAQSGRTVLFVSHNMAMIRSLCQRAVLLDKGKVIADGPSGEVAEKYLSLWSDQSQEGELTWSEQEAPGCDDLKFLGMRLLNREGQVNNMFDLHEDINIELSYKANTAIQGMRVLLSLETDDGVNAFVSSDHAFRSNRLEEGVYKSTVHIPGNLLNRKRYFIKVAFDIPGVRILLNWHEYLALDIVLKRSDDVYIAPTWEGALAPHLEWTCQELTKTREKDEEPVDV